MLKKTISTLMLFVSFQVHALEKPIKNGRLEVICGSMFSGKSTELLRRIKRAKHAKKEILSIKSHLDTRREEFCITTHDGQKQTAHLLSNNMENLSDSITKLSEGVDVVGIDEIQFFPYKMISIIENLIEKGIIVIVAGLDLDFRGEPFSIMPELMAKADKVHKFSAICSKCGNDAHYSQRIINGKPAKYDDPIIMVGAEECYEARCRNCFETHKPQITN